MKIHDVTFDTVTEEGGATFSSYRFDVSEAGARYARFSYQDGYTAWRDSSFDVPSDDEELEKTFWQLMASEYGLEERDNSRAWQLVEERGTE